MASIGREVAAQLGARFICEVPDTGPGPFGAMRLARIVADIQSRLASGQGMEAGQPSDPEPVSHLKVRMTARTRQRLAQLAEQAGAGGRKVSPMQIAARILEDALASLPEG